MKKQKNTNKGITLIALIITIIVLLILAGVALATLTGDSGILRNSEKAKEQTNLANSKEQVALAVTSAMTYPNALGTVTYDNLVTELNQTVGNGKYTITPQDDEAESWTVTVTDTGYSTTISSAGKIADVQGGGGNAGGTGILPTGNGTTPWLPDGFSQVVGTNLTNGLVITNKTDGTIGNQNYVWIEVPNNIERTITISEVQKTITLTQATTNEEIAEWLEVYAGKGTEQDYRIENKDEWYDRDGITKESGATNPEDTAGCGMTYTQYETAYSKMLNSIKNNGGFWLAQYEAGITPETGEATATNRTKHTTIGDNPTSANYAKDQYPYNYVYCSEAQKIANADSTNEYTSSLPFGIQWDLVCKFLEVKNEQTDLTYADISTKSTWGNYGNTIYTPSSTAKYSEDKGTTFESVVAEDGTLYKKESEGAVLLTTGAIEETTATVDGISITKDASPMNIYDFAGNVNEWSLERSTMNYNPCYYRGGHYEFEGSASRSENVDTVGNEENIGFRSVLY